MKHFKSFLSWICLFCLISGSIPEETIQAADFIQYYSRWFPVYPVGENSESINLEKDDGCFVEMPGGSVLKIQKENKFSDIHAAQVFFDNELTKSAKAYFWLPPLSDSDNFEIPVSPGSGTTLFLQNQGEPGRISLYRLVRFNSGRFWSEMRGYLKRLAHASPGEILKKFKEIDNLWIQSALKSADDYSPGVSSEEIDDFFFPFLEQVIRCGQLLDNEDAYEQDLLLSSERQDFRGEDGYLTESIELDIMGPALLDLRFRALFDADAPLPSFLLHSSIKIDDLEIDHSEFVCLQDQTLARRKIENVPASVFKSSGGLETCLNDPFLASYSFWRPLYIPNGHHRYHIEFDRKMWIKAKIRRPVIYFNDGIPKETLKNPAMKLILDQKIRSLASPLDVILNKGLTDRSLGGILELLNAKPEDRLLSAIYQQKRNEIAWRLVPQSLPSSTILCNPHEGLTLQPDSMVNEIDQTSNSSFYLMGEDFKEGVLSIQGESDEYAAVQFFFDEPEKRDAFDAIEIDGSSLCANAGLKITPTGTILKKFFKTGEHSVNKRSGSPDIYISNYVSNASQVSLKLREAYRLTSAYPSRFSIDAGASGALAKFTWHPQSNGSNRILFRGDGDFVREISTEIPDEFKSDNCSFTFFIPKGVNYLEASIIQGSDGWISFLLPAENRPFMNEGRFIKGGLADKITAFFSNSHTQIEMADNADALEQFLWRSQTGQSKAANQLMLDNSDWKLDSDYSLLQTISLAASGRSSRAIEIGLPIFESLEDPPDWLTAILSKAALESDQPDLALKMIRKLKYAYPKDDFLKLCEIRLIMHLENKTNALQFLTECSDFIISDVKLSDWQKWLLKKDAQSCRLDPAWAALSPNPYFRESTGVIGNDRNRIIQLTDRLVRSTKEMLPETDSVNMHALSVNDTIEGESEGPTILRFQIRPNHSNDEASSYRKFQISCELGEDVYYYESDDNLPDREWLNYPAFPSISPGLKENLDILIAPGRNHWKITCLEGDLTVRILEQVPSIDDLPVHVETNLFEAYQQILRSIYSPEPPSSDEIAMTFAQLSKISEDYPLAAAPKFHLRKFMDKIEWHALRGFDGAEEILNLDTEESVFSYSGRASELLRMMEIPSAKRKASFDMTSSPAGTILIKSTDELAEILPVNISVLLDDKPTSQIQLKDGEAIYEWKVHSASRLTFRQDVQEKMLQKLEFFLKLENGEMHRLIPMTRKAFSRLPPNGVLTGKLWGPSVLKLELRRIAGDAVQPNGVITVEIDDETGAVLNREFNLSSDEDKLVKIVGVAGRIGMPEEQIMVLPSEIEYRIRIGAIGMLDHTLARLTAAHFEVTSVAMTTSPALKWPETATDNAESLSGMKFPEVRKSTYGPEGIHLRNQNGGTWTAGMRYQKHDGDSDSFEDWNIPSDDTISMLGGYNRRFEGAGVFIATDAEATRTLRTQSGSLAGLTQSVAINTDIWNLRGFTELSIYAQDVDDWEYSFHLNAEIKRSFRFLSNWSFTPGIGAFFKEFTFQESEFDPEEISTDSRIFNEFDKEHDAGLAIKLDSSLRLSERLIGYMRLKTISGVDDEGTFGPWWSAFGLKGAAGLVMWNFSYQYRSVFGETDSPERSRALGEIEWSRPINKTVTAVIALKDRYTFETDVNDFKAVLTFRFSAGRLFRDFDPYRSEFESHLAYQYLERESSR